MDLELMLAFWGVSMLFVLTPGVDWAYAIAAGISRRTAVVPAVSGMLTGHFFATLIVAAGVATILAASPLAMTLLTTAGALYLVWLGIGALRNHSAPDFTGQAAPIGGGKLFAKGIGISLLNPKVFLLFLALLPQFVNTAAAWPVGLQMVGLGIMHLLNCAIIYFAVGFGAAAILKKRPRAAQVVGIVSGIVMIGLGVMLLVQFFVDKL